MRRRIYPFGHFKRGQNQRSERVRDIHAPPPHKLSHLISPCAIPSLSVFLSHLMLKAKRFPLRLHYTHRPHPPTISTKVSSYRLNHTILSPYKPTALCLSALSHQICTDCTGTTHVLSSSLSLSVESVRRRRCILLFARLRLAKNIEFWTFVNQIKGVMKKVSFALTKPKNH